MAPGNRISHIKNERQYEALRDKGMSKEKSARIANSGRRASRRGGRASSYEDRTKEDLMREARRVGIEGRSSMSKQELMDALRNH
jgi:hypothetical protein